MQTLRCYCLECINNSYGECEKEYVTISNDICTAAGFLPICQDYKERENKEDGQINMQI